MPDGIETLADWRRSIFTETSRDLFPIPKLQPKKIASFDDDGMSRVIDWAKNTGNLAIQSRVDKILEQSTYEHPEMLRLKEGFLKSVIVILDDPNGNLIPREKMAKDTKTDLGTFTVLINNVLQNIEAMQETIQRLEGKKAWQMFEILDSKTQKETVPFTIEMATMLFGEVIEELNRGNRDSRFMKLARMLSFDNGKFHWRRMSNFAPQHCEDLRVLGVQITQLLQPKSPKKNRKK